MYVASCQGLQSGGFVRGSVNNWGRVVHTGRNNSLGEALLPTVGGFFAYS